MTKAERRQWREEHPCPNCNGSGWQSYIAEQDAPGRRFVQCKECSGKGYRDEAGALLNGEGK